MRAAGSRTSAQTLASQEGQGAERGGQQRRGAARARSKQRREEIMSAAAALFAQRGFHGVSIDDIGSAAGMSGPGIYRHFPSKEAVLSQMLLGISERLLAEGGRRASAAADAQEALDALLDWHVSFALSQPDLITVQTRELANVPEPARRQIRRLQRLYVEEWVTVLSELSPQAAQVRPACRRPRDVRPAQLHAAQRERAARRGHGRPVAHHGPRRPHRGRPPAGP